MESMQDRLIRLRKERLAREKARIDMLRELNLNKYNKDTKKSIQANASAMKGSASVPKKSLTNIIQNSTTVKNTVSQAIKRPLSAQMTKTKVNTKVEVAKGKNEEKAMGRKSVVDYQKPNITRTSKPNTSSVSNVSVFERLYKPKAHQNTHAKEVEKLNNDPEFLKKVLQSTTLIVNKRHTVFDMKPQNKNLLVRRSISADHFRAKKHELCKNQSVSIGEKLHKSHLKEINEDETPRTEKKKVSFYTPLNSNNITREDLQSRLKSWLLKRGKSLDSYQHLQCFGLCHLPTKVNFDQKFENFDENKENIAVESDSDDDSYSENMNVPVNLDNNWRSASIVSDSVDFNDSQTTMTTCSEGNELELVIGALNNLTELLKEGFEWSQGARWLRAIRERFPSTLQTAAYWECRAALEETRGDLPASVQCWEEAIAKGMEHSVADASLDQLLDKFMKLKISPNAAKTPQQVNSKLVDVKNVFKSTIIRFAVQKAKLRQFGEATDTPVTGASFSATPVRRSSRLRHSRTPLSLAESLQQARQLAGGPLTFRPNQCLHATP